MGVFLIKPLINEKPRWVINYEDDDWFASGKIIV